MVFATGSWGPLFYVNFVWITSYQVDMVNPSLKHAQVTTMITLLILSVASPLMGQYVDRGATTRDGKGFYEYVSITLVRSYSAVAVLAVPAYLAMASGDPTLAFFGQLLLVPPAATAGAVTGALIASSFSISRRYVSCALTYNIGQCLFSSSALVVVTAMAQDWDTWTPGIYISALAGMCALSTYLSRDAVQQACEQSTTTEEALADALRNTFSDRATLAQATAAEPTENPMTADSAVGEDTP